jgi:hypothetical protein
MYSSENVKSDVVLAIYQSNRTVFRLKDIAMLTGETDFQPLNRKLNYYVRTGKLLNPRKGLYTKPDFNLEEIACNIFAPSYISLAYVLQKAGILFQFDSRITAVTYLSRSIEIKNQIYLYRKIRGEFLLDTSGIIRHNNHVNIATPERAFLDMLYLDKDAYFDNLNPLQINLVYKLLPMYRSKALTRRVNRILPHG